ncbi:Os11g0661101 [Oryza sativa Japonica Group]|uniref:Os11g0661101 protein n=1 Tax=Oryza sativa subsp. japonica TaxID=39947 RepID=A0A0P0Y5F8_ORYSJ|nr:Os11g0661101 [Oryza sativa Japonica Group]
MPSVPRRRHRQGSCAMCSLLRHHQNPLHHAADKVSFARSHSFNHYN